MSNRSADKGKRFERECVNAAKALGLDAERARGSDGRAIGEHESVDLRIERFRAQNKRDERISKKFILNEHQDAILYRKNRGETHISIRFSEWLRMVKLLKENGLM